MEFLQQLNAQEIRANLEAWFNIYVLNLDNVIQIGLVLLAVAVGWVLGTRLRRMVKEVTEKRIERTGVHALVARLTELSAPLTVLLLLWMVSEVGAQTDLVGNYVSRTVASLASAWVIIRFLSGFIKNETISRFIAWAAWLIAALVALGLFDTTVALLDALAMNFGQVRISVLTVVKGMLALGILLWATVSVSNVLERRIRRVQGLTPSVQVLTAKVVKIVLITLAFLVAINSLGIDLTAVTVFGGALGIGIGIGLQKVMSNLLSGLLLLMDKSIKPNDVIAVGGTYGWVVSLGARYAAIRTRDGIEHLIPNEELITQRVENWSHSDKVVRLRIPLGVSYKSDIRLAIQLCVQAAKAVKRVLASPEPRCLLRGFGDSSVELEIRVWIDDPSEGRANVISEILLGVWDLFQERGIEIPFPQRDLHLKSSTVVWPIEKTRQAV